MSSSELLNASKLKSQFIKDFIVEMARAVQAENKKMFENKWPQIIFQAYIYY